MSAAKCPLGFTGDLPAGHPSVGGIGMVDNTVDGSAMWNWFLLGIDAIFIGVVVLACVYHDRVPFVASRKEIPNLKPSYPLLGAIGYLFNIIIGKDKLLYLFQYAQTTAGKGNQPVTLSIPALGGRVTFLNSPQYINYVQKENFENYEKGPDFRRCFGDVLGLHGIFVADGEIWKKQRKMASNIFSVSNFRTHVQNTIQHDLTVMRTLLGNLSKTGQQANLSDIFFRFTLSSFSTMAFSAEVDCLPTEPAGLDTVVEFAAAFDFAQRVVDSRFTNPASWVMELFSNQGRKMRACIKKLNKYCYGIIDLRLQARANGSAQGAVDSKAGKDLLELFMDQGLKRDELLPVVLNFLIAGRDTTAQSLGWLFYDIHNRPEVIAKIRDEAARVLDGRQMGYDDMKSMPYTHAAFYEAIRLHPAVPKNVKRVVKDDIIRPVGFGPDEKAGLPMDANMHLPSFPVKAGESVAWSDWVMARTPEIWGADCCEFKPERFLEERNGELSVRQYGSAFFHAFNHGPRLCLGQTLATYEGMAAVVEILQHFDVEYDLEALKRDPPVFDDSVTHPIANPYMVRFVART